eukprot:TRINITY_DN122774_c0_g1_i1.p1 TRINITY_DN122774_c0_g1~~TRINITY_DN122774_c0_g1_i1.p1  ORF type:complete len:224 (+),score=62.14 TRINITY_DN122774_c0_g1_i1:90-761(+)
MVSGKVLALAALQFATPCDTLTISGGPAMRGSSSVRPIAADLKAAFADSVLLMGSHSSGNKAWPSAGAGAMPSLEEFTPKCEEFSKVLAYSEQGDRKKITKTMNIICSTIDYPPDVQICNSYTETLLGHLHVDCGWNINGMDYTLFCQGMHKVLLTYDPAPTGAAFTPFLNSTFNTTEVHYKTLADELRIKKVFNKPTPDQYTNTLTVGYGGGTQTVHGPGKR